MKPVCSITWKGFGRTAVIWKNTKIKPRLFELDLLGFTIARLRLALLFFNDIIDGFCRLGRRGLFFWCGFAFWRLAFSFVGVPADKRKLDAVYDKKGE